MYHRKLEERLTTIRKWEISLLAHQEHTTKCDELVEKWKTKMKMIDWEVDIHDITFRLITPDKSSLLEFLKDCREAFGEMTYADLNHIYKDFNYKFGNNIRVVAIFDGTCKLVVDTEHEEVSTVVKRTYKLVCENQDIDTSDLLEVHE